MADSSATALPPFPPSGATSPPPSLPPITNAHALVLPSGGAGQPSDIHDIKPPEPVAASGIWLWLLAGLVLVSALCFWGWRRRKRHAPSASTAVISPQARAKQKLHAALNLIHDPRLFCIAVSDALRVYLEERFDLHAPERTTEEFLLELTSASQLMPDQKEALGAFLVQCDLVKFARQEPPESELRQLHEAALRLVDETQFEPITA